jgi:sigma-B regulation protein RsbU (phosphoserine phosphatase)
VLDEDSKEDFRARYERAPCGLMSTAPNGSILCVNTTLCDWLGFSASELVGKRRLQDLMTMGAKIFHQTHWLPLLQMQGSVAEVQLELANRAGEKLPVLINARQIEQADGKVQHELAILMAMDRRKYERELLAARQRAEELLAREREAQDALAEVQSELQRALQQRAMVAEQLVGIVSHDLRTPMNAIALGTNMLATSELSPRDRRTLERVTSSAKRATRLIADLLDFTQARMGGGLRVSVVEADVTTLIKECVEELRLSWPGRMIEHQIADASSGFVDPDRCAQVVINLMNNALTYGDPREPVCVMMSAQPERVVFSVHNRGTPIPEDLLPHIFEPMRRGETQVKLGSRSVGLGLYIVHEIVAAHGGAVEVSSTREDGTTFRVTIPKRAATT